MAEATRTAERIAARFTATGGPGGLDRPGLAAVASAVGIYRDGGAITAAIRHAWLAVVLRRLRIRDDAWARKVSEIALDGLRLAGYQVRAVLEGRCRGRGAGRWPCGLLPEPV